MCGIAGIVNKTKRPFDFSTFCILGIENDSRGGDSCGVFIDGKYEYGVNNDKLFGDFFQENELIYGTTSATIALLHCRKASVGKVSKETAQPVIIKDGLGTIKFVLMHNGTIHNYKELAEKYIPNIDITDMTDSQVMAHIFYYAGYDALSEYNGGAVFCIVDYRGYTPRTFFWKGSSRKTEYDKEAVEERPLWFVLDHLKRELVFSSLWLPLMAMRKGATLYTPTPNNLIEFVGNDVKIVKKYPRDKCTQNKKYESKKTPYVYDEGYWRGTNYCTNYISVDFDRNIYTYAGKPLHGRYFLNKYGKILEKDNLETAYDAHFYNGVLLKDKESYELLDKLQEKLKLSTEEFFKRYWNVVRYISYDGIYNNAGFYYVATSPMASTPFTGKLEPITTTTCLTINDGKRGVMTYSTRNHEDTIKKYSKAKSEVNFKEIKKVCKSLKK